MIIGLAWAMGRDGVVERVVAVVENRLLVRSAEQVWRAGTYGRTSEVDNAAVWLTRDLEDEGYDLVAGPTVFTSTAMSTRLDNALKVCVCDALGIHGRHYVVDLLGKSASIERTATGRWKGVP